MTGHQVVLRDTLFVPAAVRLPRRPAVAHADGAQMGPTRQDPANPMQDEAHEATLRQGREEGLRSGREEGLRAGHEEGLCLGLAAGEAQVRVATEAAVLIARAPLEARVKQIDALLVGMGEAARQAWTGAQDDVLALCYETLCRVLGEAAVTPEAIRLQVERLLAASDLRGSITVQLHPDDVRLLEEARAEGQLPPAGEQPVRWRGDARVELGGCIVAGAGGGIDARLETVLALCKQGLLQARAHRAAARAGLETSP